MPTTSADERINRLRELTEPLDRDNNRQDKASMMKILSQAHRLISESIHGTLKTFETIQE